MQPTTSPQTLSPEEALLRLKAGNARFVSGEGTALRQWHPKLVDGQSPFAVVLGCADARAPAEYVFDQGLGDLFVVRVAGNIVAPSLIGSVEFAAQKFGTRLVVVMGHTRCGAVTAAVDALTNGGTPASTNLRSIVDFIVPHVRHLYRESTAFPTTLDAAVRANAVASARELKEASPYLQSLILRKDVAIVPAVYELETGVVTFLEDR